MPLAASPLITVGASGAWSPTCVGALARTIEPVGAPEERKEMVAARLKPDGAAELSATSATTVRWCGDEGGTTRTPRAATAASTGHRCRRLNRAAARRSARVA